MNRARGLICEMQFRNGFLAVSILFFTKTIEPPMCGIPKSDHFLSSNSDDL